MVTAPDACHYAHSVSDSNIICAMSSVESRDEQKAPTAGLFRMFQEHFPALHLAYSNPVVRQLLIEMHVVFEKCRHSAQSSPTKRITALETLAISREYRSALLHCADEVGDEDENIYLRDFTIWTLFETMFFKHGDTPISLDLISWGLESFTFIDKLVQKTFKELDEGADVGAGSYWRTVCMTLTGCRFETCINLLSLLKGDKAAERLIALLSNFDWNWLIDEGKIPKLDRWKHELETLLSSDAFNSNRNILFLAQLLNGDRKNLLRAASAVVGEWWHLMPFYIFVKNPTVAYNELGPLAEECYELFKNVDGDGDHDFDPFLSILCMKDISVLQNLISNPWLSVHLLDTLLQTDSEYASIPKLVEIREFLLMDYASGLIQNSCLWEIGADYLLYCGSEGRLRLENHIEALHIEDEVMAEKLMRICVEQELDDSKACVVNTMTYEYLREGEWSAALSWALRGGRGPALDTAVNRIVWHADKDELANLSLLDHLSDYVAELESPSLAFLFNYYRFHRYLKMGDVRSAAPVLVSLISSTNVPLCFHKILFGYLMLILADIPQVQIPSENLHELVSFFRQYSIDNADDMEDTENTVRSLKRLLLTRLADAEMISVCVQ